jgi:cellulose biosynthesis protein BcsQ
VTSQHSSSAPRKSASTIAFVSAKGGSGKTVLCKSLALLLAAVGKRVLIVDCDAATNGMTLYHLPMVVEARRRQHGAHGLFEAENLREVAMFDVAPGVSLAPAAFSLKQTEDVTPTAFARILFDLIAAVSEEVDVILLDAQAGADFYAEHAVRAADKIVIVSEYDPVSAEGVERLKRLFHSSFQDKDVWTLFNKVLPELVSLRYDFLETVRILPPVPRDADVIRAFSRRHSAVDTNVGNPYTFALVPILETLMGEEAGAALAKWKKEADNFLREPVLERVAFLEREVSRLENALVETNQQQYNQRTPSTGWARLLGSLILFILAVAGAAVWTQLRPSSDFTYAAVFALLLVAGAGLAVLSPLSIVNALPHRRDEVQRERISLERQTLALQRERSSVLTELDKYRQLANVDAEGIWKERARAANDERSRSM